MDRSSSAQPLQAATRSTAYITFSSLVTNREEHTREYGDQIVSGVADAFSSADPAVTPAR